VEFAGRANEKSALEPVADRRLARLLVPSQSVLELA
jgi:hypothetical protein